MKVEVIIVPATDSKKAIQDFLDANSGIEIVALQTSSSIDSTIFMRELVDQWTIATTIVYREPLDTSDLG